MMRGFFAVGVYHPKRGCNVGTLLRSATIYGAALYLLVHKRVGGLDTCSDVMQQ